ncbi:hypothetical protein DPEC_G00063450 [Dallia pectoralis]|uniref:Uncharacterized protein n=1 Tax=Dallia pectoralis TaxID=75939 RepID=A0ACC2H7V1_DALPE|nr:hypothetical protein DPEC_G00063450 [Dallia pectoralis]
MLLCSLLLFLQFIEQSSEQEITPYTDLEVAFEKERVNISCNYSSGVTPQWYRQYPDSGPQLLVMEFMSSQGVTLKHDQKAVLQEIPNFFSDKHREPDDTTNNEQFPVW